MPASSVVPLRFADRSLTGFTAVTESAKRALAATRRLVAGDIASLVLAGETGVGKTHLAAAACLAIAEREMAAFEVAQAEFEALELAGDREARHPRSPALPAWLNLADTIVRMRLEFDQPLDDRQATGEMLRLHAYEGLVVLDDLGRERTSDWTGEVVYALVNRRYEDRRPTLVTTNLSTAELAESIYWPALSRLAEDGAFVRIDAPDHRLPR